MNEVDHTHSHWFIYIPTDDVTNATFMNIYMDFLEANRLLEI